jgi:hypothetical protein
MTSELKTPERYEVEGQQAVRVPLSDGAYFNAEVHRDYYALAWACALPIATVLERIRGLLPLDSGRAIVYDNKNKQYEILPATEVIEAATKRLAGYEFVRFEFGHGAFVWEASHYPNHVNEPIEVGEIGLIADVVDKGRWIALLRLTGTVSVGEHAEELLGFTSFVDPHVAEGTLHATD